jgi:RNA polymerase sigma-70 factor (ECF subfamily)
MTEHPDRFLVARLVRGDEAAFGEFFEAHFAPLFRFAMPRVANDAQVAEDVVQAALCRAVRKLMSYRGEAALLTWLCTFCRHEISALRESQPRAADGGVAR